MKDINKIRGCLIGGAVGDALGYAVEFMKDSEIFRTYGSAGITEYALMNGVAEISDDTQMTLFTANGLLLGTTRKMTRGIMAPYPHYISLCYKDWLKTQLAEDFKLEAPQYAWLNNIPEMNHSREPGRTCISYLLENRLGSTSNPQNNSKGCGGIMRVAPIGLYFEDNRYTIKDIDMIGAEAAALTHGHELGYIPAAMFVHMIHLLSHHSGISVLDAVKDAKRTMSTLFPQAKRLHRLTGLVDRAIAIYCSLKYEHDFEKAIIASVNHSGDSDSTGSVTGNILGAHLGIDAIPQKFLDNLELKEIILEIADDLFNDCKISEYSNTTDNIWEQKYIYHTYPNKV